MYYIISSLFCLGLTLILYAIYLNYNAKRIFLGNKFSEGRLMSFLLDKLSPPKNSPKYRNTANMIYILDNRKNIRDFLVIKLGVVLVGTFIGISIFITNVTTRYFDAFNSSAKVPFEISKEEYKILVDSLDFDSEDKEEQLSRLKSNISMLPSEDTILRFKKVSRESLYNYIENIHDNLSSVVKVGDFVLLFVLIFISFKLPRFILKAIFSILANNEFFEYDGLQTDILFLYDKSVQEIFPVLCHNAMYHRNNLVNLKTLYERDPEQMYSMVESRQEFSYHLKMLIRYLRMLENDGPEYLNNAIMTSKKQTEEEVYNARVATSKKNVKHLNILCVVSFALAIVRLLLLILKSFL